MAFKKAKDYNEERYGDFFMLRNDGDSADVIFLYESYEDVLIADVHYIKSNEYSGYAHCVGNSCPACGKGIRVQSKLFIPLYNITEQKIEFWDRNSRFENQLITDVLENYPNPSQYVFTITRHGAAGSMDTTYEIRVAGNNNFMNYNQILNRFSITLPEHYDIICKELSIADMNKMLNNSTSSASVSGGSSIPDYKVTPRVNSSNNGYNNPLPEYATTGNPSEDDIVALGNSDEELTDDDTPVDFN